MKIVRCISGQIDKNTFSSNFSFYEFLSSYKGGKRYKTDPSVNHPNQFEGGGGEVVHNYGKTSKTYWVLSKNGLRIAVGCLVKLQTKKKLSNSKNGLRIAVERLVKILMSKKVYKPQIHPRAHFTHTGDLTLISTHLGQNAE